MRERGREGEARFVDKLVWPMRLVGFQRFGKNLFGFFFLFFLKVYTLHIINPYTPIFHLFFF